MMRYKFLTLILSSYFTLSCSNQNKLSTEVPDDFVDIKKVIPEVIVDARYYSGENFVGRRIDGYLANKCYLRKEAALALKEAYLEIASKNMTFKIFDCYRPQRAVDEFILWTKNIDDQSTKQFYYPNIEKSQLLGPYIAARSGHSRGNTIDLTIVVNEEGQFSDLDMGSSYDLFDPISHTFNNKIKLEQQSNRVFLKNVLEKYGFEYYELEWWHFSYKTNENIKHLDFLVR